MLQMVESEHKGFFMLGYFIKIGKKPVFHRDTRFSPKLDKFEAIWLLRNENPK